jgi:hypothetical protein
VFLLLQACLGVRIDGGASRVVFESPLLPAGLTELRIQRLSIRDGQVDVSITRRRNGVEVTMLRATRDVDVIVS